MSITPRLLTAACVVLASSFVFSPAAFAQGGAPTNTLELKLETGGGTPPTDSRPVNRGTLSSRGGPMIRRDAPKPQVLGKLAVVSDDKATIRQGRTASSRVLSVVPQGTYLAIVSEVGDHFGVLMVDKTTGWIAKDDLKLIDYQVAVGDVTANPPPATEGELPQGLPQDLDARTVALLRESFSYLGVPYVWAGNTRAGLDCSGFVKKVFAAQGVSLPRHSGDQARVGIAVAWQDLQAGDRLYFDMGNKGRVSHTGIYLGNGYFIHASSNQKKVGVDSILKPNYYKALVGARRS